MYLLSEQFFFQIKTLTANQNPPDFKKRDNFSVRLLLSFHVDYNEVTVIFIVILLGVNRL